AQHEQSLADQPVSHPGLGAQKRRFQPRLLIEWEHGDSPVKGAVAINNGARRKKDGGKQAEDAAGKVQKKTAGATGNLSRIFLQAGRINLGGKGQMMDSLSQLRQMPGPVSGEVATVTIDGRKGKYREQRARENQHEDQKDDGEAASGAPAVDAHLLNYTDGGRQHYGKQRTYIDQHEHVAHHVCDPQRKEHAEKEQNI